MKCAALLLTVLTSGFGWAASQLPRDEPVRPLICVSPVETRELFLAQRLRPPFRVMQETSAGLQADALDIQLCRFNSLLVYDVTLLSRDGRVLHRLVNATTGALLGGPAKP